MGVRSRFRPEMFVPVVLFLIALTGVPSGGQAAHDLNRDCYVCHNIKGGTIWNNSYSIWSGRKIGMTPYSRPITCDFCHTDYGQRFGSTSVSKHPVRIIVLDNTLADNNVYGSSPPFIDCRDCHSGNGTAGTPNLNPDVSPLNYSGLAGNGASDGYPNHDNTIAGFTIVSATWGAGNVVTPGTEPHLGSSYDPAAGYNKIPSNAPLTDYALCFSCHDGTAGRTNRRVDVKTKYTTGKGHYYKYGTPTGGANGMKMPCSDCHASHNVANNSRLYVSPKGSTVVFSNPVTPTAQDIRTICIDCHDDYNNTNTGNGQPLVRGVEPPVRRFGIVGHAGTDTQSCSQCHDPHDAPGGGPDCLTCHTSGGAAGVRYAYIDNLFKGVGSDNGAAKPTASGALNWSQHGGFTGNASNFLYLSPFNTKATNDCFKCHGDRHNNTFALIDADNTDSGASVFTPVNSLSAGTTTVANANAFCITCHDGNGAAGDVRIGNQVPPNVATNWATAGHGRPASTTYAVTLNKGAELKCVECHEAHGSNHNKLLPADNTATGVFAMPAGKPGMTFRNGALLASQIDFTDYSSPASGQGYGTTGDPGNQHAPPGASTGLCDACHRQAGQANGGTDNTTNRAHTHEGIVGDANQAAPSQMTFTKDCLECHNTHGSPAATPNIAMIDNAVNGFAVTFTARTGANSFDPLEAGATPNVNSVCVVCHQSPTENATLNVGHNFRTSTVNPDHNEDTDCRSCHSHGEPANAARFGFPQGGCTTCHGNGTNGTFWPDNAAVGAAYPNRAGAHQKHVTAIGTGNSSCTTCHPGNPPAGHPADNASGANQAEVNRMDTNNDNVPNYWTTSYFRTISGGIDNAGFYNTQNHTCSNLSCHGGSTTFDWYYRVDNVAPAWASGMGISAIDCAVGGTLQVQWARAADAFPSNPVRYDLYMDNTSSAAAVYGKVPVYTDLLDNVAVVSGLTNGMNYYFGVRAKDSWTIPNVTTDNTISAARAPTAPTVPAGTATTYYAQAAAGTFGADGSQNPTASGATIAVPAFTRQPLTATAPATTFNVLEGSFSSTTTFVTIARFYLPKYATDEWIGPNLTAGNIAVASTNANDNYALRLIDYDPAGAAGNGTPISVADNVVLGTGGTTYTARGFTLNFNRYLLSRDHQLVLEVRARPTATTNVLRIQFGNNAATTSTIRFTIPILAGDNAAPVWAGGVSGITAVDNQVGGAIRVSWNTATDAYPSNPVTYDLYRSDNLATLWSSLHGSFAGTTNILDTGLANGTRYYYGVRARDSWPTPNATTNIDNASAVPTGGAPVQSCTACHGMPPASDPRNAGSHVKHVPAGSPATACNRCHPGASSYGFGHQDGKGKLGFKGTAYFANISGNRLYYTDNVATFYDDTNGYGYLTGVAGDNTDNGTCSATVCHGSATPQWGGAAIPCGTCHGTLGRTGFTDTSTDPAGAPPATLTGGTENYKVGQHLKHLNVSYGKTGDSCNVCHNTAGKGTVLHGDNTVNVIFHPSADNGVAGSATFTDNLAPGPGTCSGLSGTGCHGTARWDNAAVLSCAQCHTTITAHVTKRGVSIGCTGCHPGSAAYPQRHSNNASANIITIPNYATVGINTPYGGIHLGGDNTLAAPGSEAKICWSCHDAEATRITEWGANTHAITGNKTYNFGQLCTDNAVVCDNPASANWQSDWTLGWWRSAYDNSGTTIFRYKRNRIQSTHSANPTAGVQGMDAVANIRCSYCHDVHDRNLAPNDTMTGQPYLRGGWITSPYNQDGAPQPGQSYNSNSTSGTNHFGAVPRASPIHNGAGGAVPPVNQMGGYWIDQNMNNPNIWTPTQFGGLCDLCHGTGTGTLSASTIANLNQFGNPGDNWVSGYNGHANSVKGGPGPGTGAEAAARNIFADGVGGRPFPVAVTSGQNFSTSIVGDMNMRNQDLRHANQFGLFLRNNANSGGSSQPAAVPRLNPASQQPNTGIAGMGVDPAVSTSWRVTVDNTTTQANYHQFTCSKCHNPHASRLPRLMITNCLDTKHNSWDDNMIASGATLPANDNATRNRSLSQWSSAVNCHRLDQEGRPGKTLDGGWNNVTPW